MKRLDGKTLLMVDYDMPVRYLQYYIQNLQEQGAKVIGVETPDEALVEIPKHEHLDLILVETIMHGNKFFGREETVVGFHGGVLFAQELQRLKPDIPLVVFTLLSKAEVIEELAAQPNVKKVEFKRNLSPKQLMEIVGNVLGCETAK